MKLQTQIPLKKAANQIGYNSQLLLLGSCFSEHIGKKFDYFKFQNLQNPFGILFHPKAIENLVERAIQQEKYVEADVFYRNERWHCFDAHSDLSDSSKEQLLDKLNKSLESTYRQMTRSTHIIITLGTAWAYRYNVNDKLVANCHKVPQKEFSKELLSVSAVTESLENIIQWVRKVNKAAHFVFTVSPVRHLKDGFVENQQSKAHLISAIHEVLRHNATLSAGEGYFPSYELMMDELRDYRFYESDMVHPNQLGIDYIWEKFKYVWISDEAYPTLEEVDRVHKGLKHRPFHPDSEGHQVFIKNLKEKIMYLQRAYPFMQF